MQIDRAIWKPVSRNKFCGTSWNLSTKTSLNDSKKARQGGKAVKNCTVRLLQHNSSVLSFKVPLKDFILILCPQHVLLCVFHSSWPQWQFQCSPKFSPKPCACVQMPSETINTLWNANPGNCSKMNFVCQHIVLLNWWTTHCRYVPRCVQPHKINTFCKSWPSPCWTLVLMKEQLFVPGNAALLPFSLNVSLGTDLPTRQNTEKSVAL